jgi:hypothetical protein
LRAPQLNGASQFNGVNFERWEHDKCLRSAEQMNLDPSTIYQSSGAGRIDWIYRISFLEGLVMIVLYLRGYTQQFRPLFQKPYRLLPIA